MSLKRRSGFVLITIFAMILWTGCSTHRDNIQSFVNAQTRVSDNAAENYSQAVVPMPSNRIQCTQENLHDKKTLTPSTIGSSPSPLPLSPKPKSTGFSRPSNTPLPIGRTKTAKICSQIITVTTKGLKAATARVNVYEKSSGKWKQVYKNLYGVVGIKGMMYNRKQNTKTTPVGVFSITQGFGKVENPGVKFLYRKIQNNDYWVTDPKSKYYNTWQKGPANGRWDEEEQEHLIDKAGYKYVAVIDFNTDKVPYVGAAIFLHVISERDKKGTIGCVAMSENDLLKVLKWIDPSKETRIILCPENDLGKF